MGSILSWRFPSLENFITVSKTKSANEINRCPDRERKTKQISFTNTHTHTYMHTQQLHTNDEKKENRLKT